MMRYWIPAEQREVDGLGELLDFSRLTAKRIDFRVIGKKLNTTVGIFLDSELFAFQIFSENDKNNVYKEMAK